MSERKADCCITMEVDGIGAGDPRAEDARGLGVGSRDAPRKPMMLAMQSSGGPPARWRVRLDLDGIELALLPHVEVADQRCLAWACVTAADARALALALIAAADMEDQREGRSSRPA